MEEFKKNKSCGISAYDNWNFKPQISSIFHFDQASDSRMAHVLGVKKYQFRRTFCYNIAFFNLMVLKDFMFKI